jgi:hypothetical protein
MTCLILAVVAGCQATATPKPTPTTPTTQINSSDCKVLADIAAPGHRIRIESFGSPPELLRQNVIRGSGLTLKILDTNTGQQHTYRWDEAHPQATIDYSRAASGIVQVVEFTIDARPQDAEVPLVRRTIAIGESVAETDQILLQPEHGDPARIACLEMQAINGMSSNAGNRGDWAFDEPLIHLRNIGIDQPAAVLEAFRQIAPKAEGAAGESLAGYQKEIETVNSIRNGANAEQGVGA